MRIYLVRHTEYTNPENLYAFYLPFNLSPEGKEKAQKIAKWFEDKNLREIPIYTSPIVRTVQTAEIIASRTNSVVSLDERLIEVACPALQGKKKPADKSWVLEEEDPSRETRSAVLDRILSIFDEKIQIGKDCVFVSHGEGLTLLYYYLLKKPLPKYLWDPILERDIINKGEMVTTDIDDNIVTAVNKIPLDLFSF